MHNSLSFPTNFKHFTQTHAMYTTGSIITKNWSNAPIFQDFKLIFGTEKVQSIMHTIHITAKKLRVFSQLTSCYSTMQQLCCPFNAYHQVHLSHSVMFNKPKIRYRWQTFNGFHMQPSFKFQSPAHSTKNLVLVPKE